MINKFRLDKNTQPEKYEIFIEPDLDNEKFTGNESIKLFNSDISELRLNKFISLLSLNFINLKSSLIIDEWALSKAILFS